MDIMKKLEELENADALKQALEQVTSEEELYKVLKQHGVEMTAEEIEAMAEHVKAEDELGEEDLDMVSGGSWAVLALMVIIVVTYYKIKKYKEATRR